MTTTITANPTSEKRESGPPSSSGFFRCMSSVWQFFLLPFLFLFCLSCVFRAAARVRASRCCLFARCRFFFFFFFSVELLLPLTFTCLRGRVGWHAPSRFFSVEHYNRFPFALLLRFAPLNFPLDFSRRRLPQVLAGFYAHRFRIVPMCALPFPRVGSHCVLALGFLFCFSRLHYTREGRKGKVVCMHKSSFVRDTWRVT